MKNINIKNAAILILLTWSLIGILAYQDVITGAAGDSFGSINALFSGFAFLGIIYTVILQSKELALQREELTLTRKVLSEQTTEMEAQNKHHEIQNFENTFFNLLKLRQQIVDSTQIIRDSGFQKIHGGAVYLEYADQYLKIIREHKIQDEKISIEVINKTNAKFDEINGNYFLPYINNICALLNFINKSTVIKEKNFYLEVLFSSLAESELILVLYHLLEDEYYQC